MANPWEMDWSKPQQATGAPVMLTQPRAKQRDQFDVEDQSMQREANDRANAAAERATANAERQTRLDEAKLKQGDPKLVESERTAAFLATRLKGSLTDIANATRNAPDANRPSVLGTVAGVFGTEARNAANSPERQRVEAAQMDALDAALTLGTGAAYTREQLEAYRQSYFPMLTDDETTVADKRVRFARLLEAAKLKAGNAAPQIDEAIAALSGQGGGNTSEASLRIPDDQFKAQLAERLKKGDDFAGIVAFYKAQKGSDPSPDEMNRLAKNFGYSDPQVLDNPDSGIGRALYLGVGDAAETVGDALGIVANPVNAGINAVFGTDIGTDLGATFRSMTGAPSPENDSERLASGINRGGIGAMTFGGAAGMAAKGLSSGAGNALASFGGSPGFNALSGSAAGGAGEMARQGGAGPVGQAAASLAGGIGGGAAAMRMAPRAVAQPNALAQAGQAEGVTVRRAMVDPNMQPRTAGVQATMIGGPIVNREMAKTAGQIEGRVAALGRGGEAVDPAVGGDMVRNAAMRDIKASGIAASRQYDRAEKLAGDTKVTPTNAIANLKGHISELSESPKGPPKALTDLLDSISNGKQFSVKGLRLLRTSMREEFKTQNLTGSDTERRAMEAVDALSDDIANGLTAAGKGNAAAAFKSADGFYRERMDFIKNTVQGVIGKRDANLSPEKVFSRFKAMASPKGDSAGLARMMRTMKDDETDDIAATFASELGRNGKGEFSTAFLATQAQKLPQAARVNLFGTSGAESLANLQKLATEHARVMGGLNSSRTGQAADYRSWLTNAVLSTGAGLFSGSGTTAIAAAATLGGVKAGRDILTARMVMSPEITKWLATAPRTTSTTAINSHYGRLSAIAAKNPALQTDIAALQQTLMNAANDMPGRIAASGQGAENQQADAGKRPPQ